ncbi:MAG: sulfatase-like hydrolase/transferase [Planctomycetes bacterium]|nr:sulfatase-like hydrolase/transferase [Planctomycetota bacterium]
MKSRLVVGCVGLALLGWAVTHCVQRAEAKKPPRAVVLITLDTVRADRLGAYGSTADSTPTLDRIAAEGVRFARCLTVAPITLPAHASILTGLDPIEHGVRLNGAFALDAAVPTLATQLREQGYRTGAFVSAFVLDRRFGLDEGFDVYDDQMVGGGAVDELGPEERRGGDTVARALEFVDRAGDQPCFLWVHLFDAHAPYEAPAPFSTTAGDPYGAEVAYVDDCVRQLLDGLDRRARLDDALVAVVADHGEGLGEHGERTHTLFLYDTTMHVPWILWSKHDLPRGRVVEPTVSTTAVTPTLLALLDVPRPAEMTGAALTDLVRGTATTAPAGAFVRLETQAPAYYYGFAPLSGAEVDGAKLIVAPRPELYFPRTDPDERDDRFASDRGRADAVRRALDEYERSHAGSRAHRHELGADDEQMLAQLGYVGSRAKPSNRDPKDGIALFDALITAGEQSGSDPAMAERTLNALLDRDPDVAEAYELLGDVQAAQGHWPDARDSYGHAIRLRAKDPVLYTKLGEVLLRAQRADEAKQAFEVAIQFDPTTVRPRMWLAGMLEADDRAAALALYNDVVALAPQLVAARKGRARCLLANGNARLAEQDLRKGLDLEPNDVDMLVTCGRIHEEALRNPESALELYRKALAQPTLAAELRSDLERRVRQLEH